MNKKKNHINRRDFLKIMGAGTVTATAALYGCGNKNGSQNKNNLQTDGTMTYRRNPHGDDVSLLGYGCMRWPTRKNAEGKGDELDQETINELVDYAIAPWSKLFRHIARLLQRAIGKSYGYSIEPTPEGQIFHRHQTIQFCTEYMESGGFSCHVS